MLNRDDLTRFHSGRLFDAYRKLGAHCTSSDGHAGVSFVTWAPSAASVSVVGDFNEWDGRRHPMRRLGKGGVWELFVAGIMPGAQYKFELRNARADRLVIKTDPYARSFLSPANTNARVTPASSYGWRDAAWLARRRSSRWAQDRLNIYEVHLGSWRRRADGSFARYEDLARELTSYARDLHFTHIELLPVFEHPLNESLGYQITGYFAPTSRFGPPDDFRAFVDCCHEAGVGVILDWVPLHFPKDDWALREFDGGPLYERDDPNMAEHPQWRTLIFNYGRPEVRNFLLSNALYWLLEFHVDGLRVDAVSSMLYLDDARVDSSWKTNPLGGRENLPAVRFLREMNAKIAELVPDALTIAEESTSWPSVSQPPARGGLGFSMKWNMGWVHDTLHYLGLPWPERPHHHGDLTFERLYAAGERFVLALSHDEVSSRRGSLLEQMYGEDEQKFAALRALLTYHATYPGKKLTFMGNEFAQRRAWDATAQLDWQCAASPPHRQVGMLVRDLGALYQSAPALYARDFDRSGFRWIDADDAERCVIAFARESATSLALAVFNFSPATYDEYRLGTPRSGAYSVVLDSDARIYGGSGALELLDSRTQPIGCSGFEQSLRIRLPALTGVVLTPSS